MRKQKNCNRFTVQTFFGIEKTSKNNNNKFMKGIGS